MKEIAMLKQNGCTGFVTIEKLMNGEVPIINDPGVYFILRISSRTPIFLNEGTGGYHKKRNPNVSIDTLKDNWVEDTCVMYIGKATSLKKRLNQYMKFGQGKPVGHWGGRYIWQLKDASELIVCWKPTETPEIARETEYKLIQKFKKEHNGKRPFANLRD